MLDFYNDKWKNPSGLLPNPFCNWKIRKCKLSSNVIYIYPGSYYRTSVYQFPLNNEDHPCIMIKIEEIIITEIPWNEDILGDSVL